MTEMEDENNKSAAIYQVTTIITVIIMLGIGGILAAVIWKIILFIIDL